MKVSSRVKKNHHFSKFGGCLRVDEALVKSFLPFVSFTYSGQKGLSIILIHSFISILKNKLLLNY